MNEWFTIVKIDNTTFSISEYKHWEQTHSYLLIGEKKALLIDTGLGVSNIKNVVLSITNKPIQAVTTHVHWDHIGGHKNFDNIAVYEEEKKWLESKFPISLQAVKSNLMKEYCSFPKSFNIDEYEIFQGNPNLILYDGNIISLGNREIQVIHTPGHSPGHICLYEKEKGYLFSGDLIYQGTLDAFYPTTDPIDFMQSIKKVKKLNIERILPAHYSLNISSSLIDEIDKGFSEIYSLGKLKQGNAIFKFQNFNIHI
ncbi:MBL fold metallo-hydrolase [Clostridium botulinum]|uniref:MBL fold metallo-hydrolase n=1 Tax=Clostridium botulinum TaxID=1491 RepID=UPI0009476CAC|nr:MBL fold metallo-hydrolase [Clostridium botulinum]APQ76027.1 metallo-beta-lactamase superfamily protein [Clostridium botulinum]MBN3352780.1 MBL fold metallo-hydrolase [Clostridium botulinum]QDY28222.1 MBL fold metallo-hydrolase [Clostridium botulinum]